MENRQNFIRRRMCPDCRLIQLMPHFGKFISSSIPFPIHMTHNAIIKARKKRIDVTNMLLNFHALNLPPSHNNINQCFLITFKPDIIVPTIFKHQFKASSKCSEFSNGAISYSNGFSIAKHEFCIVISNHTSNACFPTSHFA
ncbi:hypothetical protein AAHE18_20G048600 [Arachis hypogaea]